MGGGSSCLVFPTRATRLANFFFQFFSLAVNSSADDSDVSHIMLAGRDDDSHLQNISEIPPRVIDGSACVMMG